MRICILVAAVLGDLVAELDVAAGEDAALGPAHDDLAIREYVLHRVHHLRRQLPLPAHAAHHLLVNLPRPERHLTLAASDASTAAAAEEEAGCLRGFPVRGGGDSGAGVVWLREIFRHVRRSILGQTTRPIV